MQDIQNLLTEARKRYREAGRPTIVVPDNYISHPGYSRLSALDSCALEHARDKIHTPATNPEAWDEDKEHMLEGGETAAGMFQRPMLWLAQKSTDMAVECEFNVHDDALRAAGRMDMLITQMVEDRDYGLMPVKTIVEFKHTEGQVKRSIGDMRLSYVLQCLGYSMMSGVLDMAVVLISKWGYHTRYISPVSYLNPERGFVVSMNVWGDRYYPNGEDWNTPAILNYNTVRERIAHLQNYIADPALPIPFPDPLNADKGFYCCTEIDKGRKTERGGGTIRLPGYKPNCRWFSMCHGKFKMEGNLIRVERDGDKLKFPEKLA